MRKEENLDLIKKLANDKIDTSQFRASTSLGIKKLSRKESLEKNSNEIEAGNKVTTNKGIPSQGESDSTDLSADSVDDIVPSATVFQSPTFSILGGGLKRRAVNEDDRVPVVKKRRRNSIFPSHVQQASELSWDGFSSSESSEESSHFHDPSTHIEEANVEGSSASESCEGSEHAFSEHVADSEAQRTKRERSSAFKAWARQQINEAMDFTPSASASNAVDDLTKVEKPQIIPRPPEIDPLPPELSINPHAPERKAYSVKIERSSDLQEARLKLPVAAEEQKIMEAIFNHSTVVICGATGSGKTTQVPQFLFEAGFGSKNSPNPGLIGVTQPRRVAAVSMAKRVGDELGDAQEKVSYQIRFDSSVGCRTAIKFMTDGILVREISNDFSLSNYSVIVIDEAHERSTNTDILIGMVSRIVDLRKKMSQESDKVKPLKMIIMSATLRTTDFLENPVLFKDGPPPLIQAEGRQYPVTTHFARRTHREYINEAFHKICRGHKKLPPGGMLVFLTGQNEISTLSAKLKEALPTVQSEASGGHQVRITANDAPLEIEDMELEKNRNDLNGCEDFEEEDVGSFTDEDDQDFDIDDKKPSFSFVHILPLYSQLQTKDQLRVFRPPPENHRLIVLATNIAETSLTIPGIRYVFDCGRAKARIYDRAASVQSFEIGWISKASAQQRAGRAGRTGPGHCYRLYSSAVYERDFEEHGEPEILRTPVEGVVLQLKSMNLLHVANFPFPTPPDRQSLAKAEKLLTHLGAISSNGKLTPLGHDLSLYPISPRFAKMLSIGHQHKCMPYTIALVAALATPNILIAESQLDLSVTTYREDQLYTNEDRLADDARTKRRSAYNHAHHLLSSHSSTSDALKLLTAVCAYAHATDKAGFCANMFLSLKAVSDADSFVTQLCSIMHNTHPAFVPSLANISLTNLPSPSKVQITALQQFVAAGFIDQVAILASAAPNAPAELGRKPRQATDVPFFPLLPLTAPQKVDMDITDTAVYIHPSSVLAHCAVKDLPTYVVYHRLQRAPPSTISDSNPIKRTKTRMHPLSAVTGHQLATLAKGTALLEYGKPIGKVEESEGGRKRTCWVIPSLVGEKRGVLGWPLPAVKAIQTKVSGKAGWQVESIVE